MATSPDQPFVEFLSQPENFRTALVTTRIMDQVRLHVRRSFMKEVEASLTKELAAELRQGWKLEYHETQSKERRWPGITIIPEGVPNPRYGVRIEHEWNIYHGIWSMSTPFTDDEVGSVTFQAAHQELVQKKYTTSPRPQHWLGFRHPAQAANDQDSALLLLVEQREEVLGQTVRNVAEDFRDHLAKMVVRLNGIENF